MANSTEWPTTEAAMNSTEDPCTASEIDSDYQLWQNVSSIFIVLVISAAGTMTAILLGSRSRKRKDNRRLLTAIRIMKYFGVGVILSTAWIHILPDAFGSLGDPCLTAQPGWGDYGALAGVFGIGATFIIQAIEFAILNRSKAYAVTTQRLPDIAETENRLSGQPMQPVLGPEDGKPMERSGTEETMVDFASAGQTSHHVAIEEANDIHNIGHQHCSIGHPVADGAAKAKDIGTLTLELGIVVHSIVIGLTLGVASGQEWLSLLIAICFHQLFEGIALGTLISELNHVHELPKRIGLGLAYPITTPIGTAIGIGIHLAYSSQALPLLISKGVLNSLAAGILMYNSYVELLALEINHSKVFHTLSPTVKGCSFLAMYIGATLMAVLAIWA